MSQQPARAVWLAWALALLGGLAVFAAIGIALTSPCLQDGQAMVSAACEGSRVPGVVTGLALGGTTVAVAGGGAAAVLTLRRLRRRPHIE